MKETGKKLWGSSIEFLQNARDKGKSQIFSFSYDACFAGVEQILLDAEASVYLDNKPEGYIVAMNFKGHVDTTQAGIFFTDLGDGRTKIDVSSLSPQLVLQVSEMIYDGLNTMQSGKKEEGK